MVHQAGRVCKWRGERERGGMMERNSWTIDKETSHRPKHSGFYESYGDTAPSYTKTLHKTSWSYGRFQALLGVLLYMIFNSGVHVKWLWTTAVLLTGSRVARVKITLSSTPNHVQHVKGKGKVRPSAHYRFFAAGVKQPQRLLQWNVLF